MILTDNETKIDLLNNEAIAATIIKLLRDRPDQPVTVGVHGDWGAGKSSVLEMIEAGFEGEAKVLCLKFNGWRFQGFEDAKIALIEGIVTGLIEKRPALTAAAETVKDVFRRIDWLKVAKKAGGLAFTAFRPLNIKGAQIYGRKFRSRTATGFRATVEGRRRVELCRSSRPSERDAIHNTST